MNITLNSTDESICISDDWNQASVIKNFMLDDPLLDWLNLYAENKNIKPDIQKESDFNQYLSKQSIIFKKDLYTKINSLEKIISLPNTLDIKSRINNTYSLMKKGTPVINNCGIINNNLKRFDTVDYLIRSDKINDIFGDNTISNIEFNKGCRFSNKWHYCLFDVRFIKLSISDMGELKCHNKILKYYKSKALVYNSCIGFMQNYVPSLCYLIGRNDDSEKIGKIFTDNKTLSKIERGFKWINDVKKNGINWDIDPPQKIELYPNMCNNDDYPWKSIKKKIANNIKEVTLIWNMGVKERKIAHQKGKLSWDQIDNTDFKFNEKNKKIVNNIVKINKENDNILYPNKIDSPEILSLLKKNVLEYYIDFESINDLNITQNRKIDSMTFMIGCLVVINLPNNNTEYIFKDFTVNTLKKREESRIFNDWINFMNDLNKKYNIIEPKLYHWGCAEKVLYSKAFKNNLVTVPNLNFIDLLQIFKEIPIAIKGVFDYSLKNISKALYSYGYINNTWEDYSIDGREAMVYAWLSNDISKMNNQSMKEISLIRDIQKYNYIDCKVVQEIISVLRNRF